jgi:hypothetical protein
MIIRTTVVNSIFYAANAAITVFIFRVPLKIDCIQYLLVPHDNVPETHNAGFSMYVAAWPLLRE